MSGPLQTGFQGLVYNQPAPGEAGDFYGVNPRAVVIGGPGQFVAPAGGLTVGNFCWVNATTGEVSQSYVPGWQIGFLHRENNAVIINFLAPATMQVLQGLPLSLFSEGDFWAKFAAGATPGQLVYADPDSGAPVAGSTAPTTAALTGDAGFTGTAAMGASFTGEVTSNVLTASAVTGYLTAGDLISSASIVTPVALGAQLTGTPGGAGTYTLVHADVVAESMVGASTLLHVTATVRGALEVGSVVTGGTIAGGSTVTGNPAAGFYSISGAAQTVASGTKAANTTLLNVSALASGVIGVGDVIAGSGVTGGTQITSQVSGTPGGVGTYRISVAQNFASTAVTVGSIATPWFVNSAAAAGELAKISTWG
jgi:hypothetical protein